MYIHSVGLSNERSKNLPRPNVTIMSYSLQAMNNEQLTTKLDPILNTFKRAGYNEKISS